MTKMTSIEEFGVEQGLRKGIAGVLKVKFGVADAAFMQELEKAYLPTLEKILDAIDSAQSIDDLRATLPAANGSTGT